MIKFDLGPADSRVSSNSDKLVLYDTENGGFIDLYARNVYTNSDAASKTNIQSLGSATATLTQLRPVSFEWADKAHYFKTSRRSTGVSIPKKWDSLPRRSSRYFPTSWPWIARATVS
ncbi:MAG: tail fiber domain-containing protein [Alistipes finegoldii]